MEEVVEVLYGEHSYFFNGLVEDPITQFHVRNRSFYELETLETLGEHLKKLADPQFCVIDAGANIGNHSVYFSRVFPGSTVVAFEMNPETHTFLASNIERNGCSNVIAINKGVSDRRGQCGIRHNHGNPLGGAQLDLDAGSDQVTLTTIDEEMYLQGLAGFPVALIKVDVEGHELQCLKGARKTLETHRPLVFLECKENQEFVELSTLLERFGYEVVEPAVGNLPNFLFVHRERVSTFFNSADLYEVRKDLCARHVAAWQFIRKIRHLEQQIADLRSNST